MRRSFYPRKCFRLTLILLLVFALSSATVFSSTDTNVYDREGFYKVSYDNPIWKTFQTTDEMRAAVRLDERVFKDLPTEDVLIAVLEYPLACDVVAYSTNKLGVEALSEHCTALRVFLAREDAYKVLMVSMGNIDAIKKRINAPTASKNLATIVLKEIATYMSSERSISALTTSPIVYTPNGTAVYVASLPEIEQDDIDNINYSYISAYPQAQYVSTATRKYNCHSYAWYWSSPSNIYWMDNPWAYMHDGSYTSVSTPSTAHKAFYSSNHSANIYDATGNSFSNTYVISKWGTAPLMIHKITYGPYGGSITLWKR